MRKLLAEHQSLTLDEVAGRVGYSSGFSFSKAFKRAMDVSPQEYRKRKSNPGVEFYV